MRNRNDSGITVFIGALIGFLMLAILIGVLVLSWPGKSAAQEQVVGIGVMLSTGEMSLVDEESNRKISLGIYAEVRKVLPDSPAEAAGLMAGDMIVAINGQNIREMSEDKIITSIRGEEGTYVTISVYRSLKNWEDGGEINPDRDSVKLNFKIKREKIKTN